MTKNNRVFICLHTKRKVLGQPTRIRRMMKIFNNIFDDTIKIDGIGNVFAF